MLKNIHESLQSQYHWYRNWHQKPFAKRIHLELMAVFVLLLLSTTFFFLPQKPERSQASSLPAVFFMPHQDDEYTMAGAIKEHLDAGRNVQVVMVTAGSSTAARGKINGKSDTGSLNWCVWHNMYHNPTTEGYLNVPVSKKNILLEFDNSKLSNYNRFQDWQDWQMMAEIGRIGRR